ncbi:CDP-alcohol phosphatidyltransferase family protein [Alicyclobacillus ferrooxydans]|uniref:CDP-diacylglycerol--glycerol-3-phosphate 3-phosphatidyltransferase n=1 Tax=Alicyclobacillus ferrooxydans TaxID=471514 RepID=A0A0N8PNU0_9BACL|nr:CDP-alcohol phosphatidyltransferase family protein [Alicyclobacillus ferrooxydans]KPV42461.1 CDP-diacylglycerol--glycerol-3-phosphate 3-phosphatidyltransferase [Alicyclobacillus ferrooxydans]
MNLPNILTVFRLVLMPVYLWAFFVTSSPHKVGALIVLLLAGATDVLDGQIARRRGLVTQVGQLLDPLADKLMMLAVLFSLLASHRVPWLVAGLLVLRDAAMIVGSAIVHVQGRRAVPKANFWGKLTTVTYYITVCVIILAWPNHATGVALLWFTVFLSYMTTVLYLVGMKLIDVRRRIL